MPEISIHRWAARILRKARLEEEITSRADHQSKLLYLQLLNAREARHDRKQRLEIRHERISS